MNYTRQKTDIFSEKV